VGLTGRRLSGAVCPLPQGTPRVFFMFLGLTPEMRASQPDQYGVNKNSMKSQQYPSEVNVLSKRVNRLSNSRQLFPVERVNFFRMDRQMLKNKG